MYLGYVSLNTPTDVAAAVLGPDLESRGFESLWVGEHPQIPVAAAGQFHSGLLDAQKHMWDPFLSLGAAAATTSSLRLGTAVVLPLERELFTFAKEVATLDHLSAGRLVLGVGVGFRAELELARQIAWADRYRALGRAWERAVRAAIRSDRRIDSGKRPHRPSGVLYGRKALCGTSLGRR